MPTHMAAVGGNTRLDSALVARWPEQLDIVADIFVPGKVVAFKQQYTAALASRKLYWVISEIPITMQQIASANPNATGDEVANAFDNTQMLRQNTTATLATLLPQLIKSTSLSYQQASDLADLVTLQDA